MPGLNHRHALPSGRGVSSVPVIVALLVLLKLGCSPLAPVRSHLIGACSFGGVCMAEEPEDDMKTRFSLIELDLPEQQTVAHSVVKAWVFALPYRMQAVLLSALRGCDGRSKNDPSKHIVRSLRATLLNQADPTNSFMAINLDGPPDEHVDAMVNDLDSYPLHFVTHLAHASEIVGFKYPDKARKVRWLAFYYKIVKGLHMMPETEAQLDVRLGFTPHEMKTAAPVKAKDPEPIAAQTVPVSPTPSPLVPQPGTVPPPAVPSNPVPRPPARRGRPTPIARPQTPQEAMEEVLREAQRKQQEQERSGSPRGWSGTADPDTTVKWDAGTGTSHKNTRY